MAVRYDKEFKTNAIELASVSNQPIAQTARDLGLEPPTLYSWIDAYKKTDVSHYPKPKETLEFVKNKEE